MIGVVWSMFENNKQIPRFQLSPLKASLMHWIQNPFFLLDIKLKESNVRGL